MNAITAKVINKSGIIEIKSAKALIKELFKIMPDITRILLRQDNIFINRFWDFKSFLISHLFLFWKVIFYTNTNHDKLYFARAFPHHSFDKLFCQVAQ